jgi:uncharacterized repeat protein (TIGR04076 family)
MENIEEFIKNPQKFHETYSKDEMLEFAKQKKAESRKTRTTFKVEEIRGVCPIYKVGDTACVIDADIHEELNYELCDRICMSLVDNMHYRTSWTRALREDYDHLTVTSGEVRTCCTHPGPPYTPCGGVTFIMYREDLNKFEK